MNSTTSLPTITDDIAENTFKSSFELRCAGCSARLTELKRQSLKHMLIEFRKIINGTGNLSLDNLLLLALKNIRLESSFLTGTFNGICSECGTHVEYLKKKAFKILQSTNFATFASKHYKQEATSSQVPFVYKGSVESENRNRIKDDSTDVELKLLDTISSPSESPSAAHFFSEAAKMFNIPNKRKSSKKKSTSGDTFQTNFNRVIKNSPPDNPPGLFKYVGRRVDGKVTVMLRITTQTDDLSDSIISVDQRKRHISIKQPTQLADIPQRFQSSNASPKLFAFDAIFEPGLAQSRVSATALLDVLHAVINGGDGCLISYGAASVGKTKTMIGEDTDNLSLGIIPCAITWLYRLIEDSKQRVGSRISVRISAVEVVGKSEILKDLLAEQCSGCDSTDSSGGSPGIYLCEDPIGGTVQLGNVSEPQAVTAEKAAFLLDAALEARTKNEIGANINFSHMIFTVHVYQYRVDKGFKSGPGGAVPYSGGRSRLHLIDLSSVNSSFDSDIHGAAPSHAGLGQIIVAMLNGFKQVPYRDSKITRLLKDSIGNPTCRSTLIAHISEHEKNFSKTCYTLQLASKVNKSRRKKNLNCCTNSDPSSCEESNYRYPNPAMVKTYGIDDTTGVNSDYNTSSAGEDSCDTVIYMGNGHISDRDLSDNEHPPSKSSYLSMKLKLPSSSEDENTDLNIKANHERVQCLSIPGQIRKMKSTDNEIESKTSNMSNYKLPVLSQSTVKENIEKAVNIVAPLVVKSENKLNNDNIINDFDKNKSLLLTAEEIKDIKVPSDKDIRKQEKRIAKLLRYSFDNEINNGATNSIQNKWSNGYKSDTENKVMEFCSKKVDGYISAPENFKYKPVQIVKGTVRQNKANEKFVTDTKKEQCIFLLPNLQETNEICKPDDCLQKSCKMSDLKVQTGIDKYIPETNLDQLLDDLKGIVQQNCLVKLQDSSVDILRDAPAASPFNSCKIVGEKELIEKNEKPPKTVELESNDFLLHNQSHKIENLNHIITISTIPNFSVTKKSLNNIASPKLDRISLLKTANTFSRANNNEQLHKVQQKSFYGKSYSKEDTISLTSVNDSDESDVGSLYLSPALNRRQYPTRLRYRWSTVFEEDESKKKDKQLLSKSSKQEIIVTLDSEPRSGRSILQTKKAAAAHQTPSFLLTKSPLSEKKSLASPRSCKKFSLLSPKSDRKLLKSTSENRMSGCSDSSSGIGSLNSQSSSIRSREEIKVLNDVVIDITPSKSKLWPFSRSSKKSSPIVSGYASDGKVTYSSNRYSRTQKFFGSRSKICNDGSHSINDGGHSSGYDTSITDGGMTSCAEDLTDNECGGAKKKKRFLGFRRRSVNSLLSNGRIKKPMWLQNRRCQSDDEGMQIKVYEIDDPMKINKRRWRSQGGELAEQIRDEELRRHHKQLKSPLKDGSKPISDFSAQRSEEIEKENRIFSTKLKALQNHIQVVTCFDGSRKTTRI